MLLSSPYKHDGGSCALWRTGSSALSTTARRQPLGDVSCGTGPSGFTNEGRRACSLRGVPGAAVQDSNGHLIGGKLPASGKGPLVTLNPGATAYFRLIIHDGGAVCLHPANGQVVIYLPGQRQSQPGWLGAQACLGLRGGGVLVPGTIRPGTGVPFYDA